AGRREEPDTALLVRPHPTSCDWSPVGAGDAASDRGLSDPVIDVQLRFLRRGNVEGTEPPDRVDRRARGVLECLRCDDDLHAPGGHPLAAEGSALVDRGATMPRLQAPLELART